MKKLLDSPWKFAGVALLAIIQPGSPPFSADAADSSSAATPPPWARRYQDAEKTVYHMRGSNRDTAGTWLYEFEADGVVKKDPGGNYYEEYAWKNLVSCHTTNRVDLFSLSNSSAWSGLTNGGHPLILSPSGSNYRQRLALPAVAQAADFIKLYTAMSEIGKVDQAMVGPVADLTTFYADLMLASRFGGRAKAGDHRHVEGGSQPNSWANGTRVLLGADCIDFECAVRQIDQSNQTATLVIDHVPPPKPSLQMPAEWMRDPVAGTPNNWMQVSKNSDGTYSAQVGKETFEAVIKLSLMDGHILSARMDNPVEAIERECSQSNLLDAGKPVRFQIRRQIELY